MHRPSLHVHATRSDHHSFPIFAISATKKIYIYLCIVLVIVDGEQRLSTAVAADMFVRPNHHYS